MSLSDLALRTKMRFRREVAQRFARRPLVMRNREPLVSFTFDDFPRSALLQGGAILESRGLVGTYYASFGLMGRTEATGKIFSVEDLPEFLRQKHELGCHTYDHCHAWETKPADFLASVLRNQQATREYVPTLNVSTLSYPISCPRPAIKAKAGRLFAGCRGGGQTFNSGTVDLNHLQAFFLEQSRDDPDTIERVIDENARQKGWLIFATHDVTEAPTRYGCTPTFFERIVGCAITSGVKIAPVAEALRSISGGESSSAVSAIL